MTDAPSIGDNFPPEPTAIERAEELFTACDDWTSKGEITDEDDARACSEFLAQLRTAKAQLKAQRDADRAPYQQALLVIDGLYKHPLRKITLAIERIAGSKANRVVGLLAAYMERKRQAALAAAAVKRREAEEAARIAERAQDRASVSGTLDDAYEAERAIDAADELRSAARRPIRASVKGDLAPRATALFTDWFAVIADWPAARKHYRQDPRVVKAYDLAVQAAANDDAARSKDANAAPAGVIFKSQPRAQ